MIRTVPETGSTNDDVAALAREGAPRRHLAARRAADRRQGAAGQGVGLAAGQSLRLDPGAAAPRRSAGADAGAGRRGRAARGRRHLRAGHADQMAQRPRLRRRQARRHPARAGRGGGDPRLRRQPRCIIPRVSTAPPPASPLWPASRPSPAISSKSSPATSSRWLARWRQEGLETVLAAWLAAAHPLGTPLVDQRGRGPVRRPRRDRRAAAAPRGRRACASSTPATSSCSEAMMIGYLRLAAPSRSCCARRRRTGAQPGRWRAGNAQAARVTITRDDWGIAHVRGRQRRRRGVRRDLRPGRGRFPAHRGQSADRARPHRGSRGRERDLAGSAPAAVDRPGRAAGAIIAAARPGCALDGRLGGRAELLSRHPSRGPPARAHPVRALDGAVLHRRQHRRRHRARRSRPARRFLRRRGAPPVAALDEEPRGSNGIAIAPAAHPRRPRAAADQPAHQLLLPLRAADDERGGAERLWRLHLGPVLHLSGLQRSGRLDAHVERRRFGRRIRRDDRPRADGRLFYRYGRALRPVRGADDRAARPPARRPPRRRAASPPTPPITARSSAPKASAGSRWR